MLIEVQGNSNQLDSDINVYGLNNSDIDQMVNTISDYSIILPDLDLNSKQDDSNEKYVKAHIQFLTYRPLLVDLNGFINDYKKGYLFIFDLDLALCSKYFF